MIVVTIVGARPQFIKAGPVSKTLRTAGIQEYLVHTGQHYDYGMSEVFFKELELPEPDINLGVGSGAHGVQTGQMLAKIEEVLIAQKPDWVLVYGDTNSTIAGALAASKLHIPVAHVEAGLRSYNRRMPEEVNRVVTDRLSSLLFCPSEVSAANLAKEGIAEGVYVVGDVMADAFKHAAALAPTKSAILDTLGLKPGTYCLATVHRAENTDDPVRLRNILTAVIDIAKTEPLVFPVHPRTRKAIERLPSPNSAPAESDNHLPRLALAAAPSGLRLIEPLGYLDMVQLEQSARLILTDSGGVQKEAYWSGVPCLTLREETEWVETIENGWNRLVGSNAERIQAAVHSNTWPTDRAPLYGEGTAAQQIANILKTSSKSHKDHK